MAILAAGQRRYLFDKKLIYLFSYDVPLRQDAAIPTPDGTQFSFSASQAQPSYPANGNSQANAVFAPLQVYHVLDENQVEQNDSIVGAVSWIRDSVFVSDEERVAAIDGAVVIKTTDDAVIEAKYKGSLSLGPLGARSFDAGSNGSQVWRAKAFIAPRFDTAYPKYKWLSERQCAAFGILELGHGPTTRATFDVYALR
jgi:hypothetical protein